MDVDIDRYTSEKQSDHSLLDFHIIPPGLSGLKESDLCVCNQLYENLMDTCKFSPDASVYQSITYLSV